MLRRHFFRLVIDLHAVCCGIRHAFMLDYAPACQPYEVESICSRLSQRVGVSLRGMSWQGCLWVLSSRALTERITKLLSCHASEQAWIITFGDDPLSEDPVVEPIYSVGVCSVGTLHHSEGLDNSHVQRDWL
jgi:hypothetical protein